MAGAGGGAWKVAYADFVTAMMAFFMVMWLVASVTKEQRAAMFEYFHNPSMDQGKSVKAALRRTQPGMYGDDCQQTKVDGFRVYPPESTGSAFVAFKTTGCKSTSVPLLQVGPVR